MIRNYKTNFDGLYDYDDDGFTEKDISNIAKVMHNFELTYNHNRMRNQYKPYTINNDVSYCDNNDCFKISITGTYFTHFGALKELTTQVPLVAKEGNLRYYGQILSLVDFAGPVTVSDSTF